MVTQLSSLPADKPIATALLADIDYLDGKRYADFNSATDHVAEYGLAALIAGVAVKKLGLFAIIAAFAAKFFKIGIVALLAFGASIRRLFKRKQRVIQSVAAHSSSPAPAVESTLPAPLAADEAPAALRRPDEHP
jgi:uncharacterized membrane-anchored protein